ncbi:MAG TPA: DUF2652 domain-containing protein, partial [Chitinophagaceae bacterium]|nr:DUF2652 domain-containing protein [Chitinophagaceae bacterium]
MIPGQPRSALLFIPDISGFTQFVTDTEISHSQHIVQELLEILIDSNHLNLEICEIEGDAIFFYKVGNKPDLESLLQQVEKMFTRFHGHLKLYEHQRICPCGACKRAVDLSLKVVVHFGEVTGISVKDHKKLFGKDVILIHRLLKNNLAKKEYVLLTDQVFSEFESKNLPPWYLPQQATEQYDVGDVQFHFSDLSSLHNNVQINLPVYNSSDRTYIAFSREEILPASLEKTFESLLDMQQQLKQPAEKNKDTDHPEDIARIGTRHPCLITRNNSINVIESVKMETERIELVEMNEKGV